VKFAASIIQEQDRFVYVQDRHEKSINTERNTAITATQRMEHSKHLPADPTIPCGMKPYRPLNGSFPPPLRRLNQSARIETLHKFFRRATNSFHPACGVSGCLQLMQWSSDASLLHSLKPMRGLGNALHELSDLQQNDDEARNFVLCIVVMEVYERT
jgi:hypothetical protein